jgi:hypothetical protein
VHAAAGVASFARPALVVGGDSRVNLVEQFGLPAVDHRETDTAEIIKLIDQFEGDAGYAQNLKRRADEAERDYIGMVRGALDL